MRRHTTGAARTMSVIGMLFFCTACQQAIAQPLTGRTIIDNARLAMTQVIGDAGNEATYTINEAANQVSVLMGTAEQMLGRDIDKTIDDIRNNDERAVLTKLSDLTHEINSGEAILVHLEDNAVLDLGTLLPGWLGFDKFVFKRIEGLNHLYRSDGNYSFTITGTGFGLDQDKTKVELASVILNDKVDITKLIQQNASEANTRTVSIPAPTLNLLGQSLAMTPIKVTLTLRKVGFGKHAKKQKELAKVTNSFYLYLFPLYAGKMNVLSEEEVTDWADDGTDTKSVTGGNNNCQHGDCSPHGWRGTVYHADLTTNGNHHPAIVGDHKYVHADFRQTSGPGGFDDAFTSPDKLILADGINVHAQYNGRTVPTSYLLTAQKMIYKVVGSKKSTQVKDCYFGDVVEVRVPVATKTVRVSGTNLANGRTYVIDLGETTGNTIFDVVSRTTIAQEFVYVLKMKEPKGT